MVRKTITEPSFNVRRELSENGVTTMEVYDSDGTPLEFNSQRVGSGNYGKLRDASYGSEGMGFKVPTFGDLAPLVYSALANRDIDEARQVTSALGNGRLAGKTMVLTGREGIFVDDNLDLRLVKGDLSEYEIHLRGKLGARQEGNVAYSDNGLVRFVPHGFQLEEQSSLAFAENPGLIALVGNSERAIMLARASETYGLNSWLGEGFAKIDSPQLRVPGVVGGGFGVGRLGVGGCCPDFGGRYSFGVRKGAEDTLRKTQEGDKE